MMFDGSHGYLASVRQAMAEQIVRLLDASLERRTSKAWWGVTEISLDETEHNLKNEGEDLVQSVSCRRNKTCSAAAGCKCQSVCKPSSQRRQMFPGQSQLVTASCVAGRRHRSEDTRVSLHFSALPLFVIIYNDSNIYRGWANHRVHGSSYAIASPWLPGRAELNAHRSPASTNIRLHTMVRLRSLPPADSA